MWPVHPQVGLRNHQSCEGDFIMLCRSSSPRLGACGFLHCSGGCRVAGSASARFQTLLVYARKRDCLTAYYEAMLERCVDGDKTR